ncbi:MAG: hypothetical protein A2499_06635 [Stygiobacter sp. RIFOXYC12_FULL_38_8]|nr:MAG: hypothetical protein A2X62_00790 [Stygiobacter sp. GWC2_38_9]OGU82664.1 MAG: hypothetical protein A2279_04350 [Stygiobacter sp. RIFOXYA12_FULL_38_9]OGV05929.1 MAG: hypothetical protein A2299_10865 [Stygiobacter sp. RIFOXYB2_FULL_37_11]OGV14520.1 MAG: hypothetical protein A2440_08760 [Stygiobacter sp. RIFOXYC2_FULL_38_25]OGV28886.1 MAG: hypothetical protein A2499_06635 [Stygiobacter sp. RIFOXYC12_FULL_38_8]OGV82280.1 MAG: hypothetical protein A2X65_18115 [Stygiobacter sp. GWF2_38_21]OG
MQQEKKDLSLKHLAHDLNNIFTRILTSIELLKHKSQSSENYSILLNNIESGTYLASEIIENAIGNSALTAKTRRVNINSIIQDVVRSFILQYGNRIKFSLTLEPKLKLINAKYTDIYRIIMNLTANAVEAINGAGSISITSRFISEKDCLLIEILDNGCGIEPDVIKHIFTDRFSTKPAENNSGIGLSIVKQLVESFGGSITVNSEKEAGTTFTITFPVAHSAKKKGKEIKKTILVAEDENLLRSLLSELLQTYNYTVLPASDGKEVLSLLENNKCDLIILDRKMPVMDGLECIAEIRKRQIAVPIILASGSQTENLEMLSFLKIDHTLNKPYNFEEMLSVIEELIP